MRKSIPSSFQASRNASTGSPTRAFSPSGPRLGITPTRIGPPSEASTSVLSSTLWPWCVVPLHPTGSDTHHHPPTVTPETTPANPLVVQERKHPDSEIEAFSSGRNVILTTPTSSSLPPTTDPTTTIDWGRDLLTKSMALSDPWTQLLQVLQQQQENQTFSQGSTSAHDRSSAAAPTTSDQALVTPSLFAMILKRQPPVHVIQYLLQHQPTLAAIPPSGPSPLQVAIQHECSREVVALLLQACPWALVASNPDCSHLDPLSYVKRFRPQETELIQLLSRPLRHWVPASSSSSAVFTTTQSTAASANGTPSSSPPTLSLSDVALASSLSWTPSPITPSGPSPTEPTTPRAHPRPTPPQFLSHPEETQPLTPLRGRGAEVNRGRQNEGRDRRPSSPLRGRSRRERLNPMTTKTSQVVVVPWPVSSPIKSKKTTTKSTAAIISSAPLVSPPYEPNKPKANAAGASANEVISKPAHANKARPRSDHEAQQPRKIVQSSPPFSPGGYAAYPPPTPVSTTPNTPPTSNVSHPLRHLGSTVPPQPSAAESQNRPVLAQAVQALTLPLASTTRALTTSTHRMLQHTVRLPPPQQQQLQQHQQMQSQQELNNVKAICVSIMKHQKRLVKDLASLQQSTETRRQEEDLHYATMREQLQEHVHEIVKQEQKNSFRTQLIALDMKEQAFVACMRRMERDVIERMGQIHSHTLWHVDQHYQSLVSSLKSRLQTVQYRLEQLEQHQAMFAPAILADLERTESVTRALVKRPKAARQTAHRKMHYWNNGKERSEHPRVVMIPQGASNQPDQDRDDYWESREPVAQVRVASEKSFRDACDYWESREPVAQVRVASDASFRDGLLWDDPFDREPVAQVVLTPAKRSFSSSSSLEVKGRKEQATPIVFASYQSPVYDSDHDDARSLLSEDVVVIRKNPASQRSCGIPRRWLVLFVKE